MSQDLLGQRPYEQFVTEKPKKWWEEALTGFSRGAGEAAGKASVDQFSGQNAIGGF